MFRLIPPAGTPIFWCDIKTIFSRILADYGQYPIDELIETIKNVLNVSFCFALSSGRAALTILLRALYEIKSDSQKNEVLIPAYTCYSVAAAVMRAGLKLRLCDVNLETLDFDDNQLEISDFSKVLAIIPCSLFGLPSNFPNIIHLAEKKQVYVVDDACQSFGVKIADRYVGTWGIAGILSFDRGKNIPAMGGGLIITNCDQLARILRAKLDFSSHDPFYEKIKIILKLLTYSVMLRPSFYWLPQHLPILKLGHTIFDANFPIEGFLNSRAAIALEMIKHLTNVNKKRKNNAEFILQNLSQTDKMHPIKPFPKSLPVYLRLPLLFKTNEMRDNLIYQMRKHGIIATAMYPRPIHQIPQVKGQIVNQEEKLFSAEKVAQTILTLPTHPYVSKKDLEKIIFVLKKVI